MEIYASRVSRKHRNIDNLHLTVETAERKTKLPLTAQTAVWKTVF